MSGGIGPVALIARREISTRVQQRGYRIGFAVALLIAVIGCVLPALFTGNDKPTTYDVGVVSDVPGLPTALTDVGRAAHVTVQVHRGNDAATARAKVESGGWDAAVVPGPGIVAKHSGDEVVDIVQAAYQRAETVARLGAAGLSPAQSSHALTVTPLRVAGTASGQSTERQAIAIIAVVFLFSQLITFCTWVATGVVEEKSSRVVELVLSSVRPLQLLAGKLLGIGALAAAQVLTLGVAALIAATASGTLSVPGSAVVTLVVTFVGFLLGFAFFAALAAGLASTVSRQEEVSGILAPMTITLTASYLASIAAANSPGSGFTRALSLIPPLSATAMPARIARGGVPVLDVVLSVVFLVVATAAIIAVAARIYRASVLHSGTRVPLRRAWRGEAVAEMR